MKRNKDCDAINTAVHRLQKRVNERLLYLIHLMDKVSAKLIKMLKQNDPACFITCLARAGETQLCHNILKFRDCMDEIENDGLFNTIREKIRQEAKHFRQDCWLVSFWAELLGTHNSLRLLDIIASSFNCGTQTLVALINSLRMPVTEEILANNLDNMYFSLVCQTFLYLTLLEFSRSILPNCKKKSRLKYRHEKVTLLILWRCGDVEQNPGPVTHVSDIARDFCKKMISLMVILYQENQLGRKPLQADYKNAPVGWPNGIKYKDPSKCTNDVRNMMLNAIQQLCIDNGLEIPIEWTRVIEKYQELLKRQCDKAKKKEVADDLLSWLRQLRPMETIDQLCDQLSEIKERERDTVLKHVFERMKRHIPDLSSQCLQSQMNGSESREMETCPTTTICATSTNESITIRATGIEIPAGDMNSGQSPGTSYDNLTPEMERKGTANKSITTENNAYGTIQPDNFTSFVGLLVDDSECFTASITETVIHSLPNAQDSNYETVTTDDEKHRKRKNDTSEMENDRDIALKRHKTADSHVATQITPYSGQSNSEEMLSTSQNTDIFDNATDKTLEDLMKIIEPELQVQDPNYGTGVRPDNSAEGDNANGPLLNELDKYLPEDFTMERLLASCEMI